MKNNENAQICLAFVLSLVAAILPSLALAADGKPLDLTNASVGFFAIGGFCTIPACFG